MLNFGPLELGVLDIKRCKAWMGVLEDKSQVNSQTLNSESACEPLTLALLLGFRI